MTEESITRGTQAEAIRALDMHYELIKKGGGGPDRWCYEHNRGQRRYIDNVWACPDCEADKVLDISI